MLSYEDVYSPMKAAQQEHKHKDRDTNVKDRQRTELSKDIKTRIHVYETKVFSLLKIQSKPTQHPVLCYVTRGRSVDCKCKS